MGRGLGQTQRAILDALKNADDWWSTVPELAAAVARDERQVRAAVRALESRGLVEVRKCYTMWRGRGEYGPLRKRQWAAQKDLPTALVTEKGDPWPGRPGWVATRRVEWVREGMPTYGLQVWLPERGDATLAAYEAAKARILLGIGR